MVDPETGRDVPSGQTGEIWLKGPAITPGYWRKPEETAMTFEQDWLKTGDLGNVDEDGMVMTFGCRVKTDYIPQFSRALHQAGGMVVYGVYWSNPHRSRRTRLLKGDHDGSLRDNRVQGPHDRDSPG